jgi:hypothetical protein
MFKRRVPGRGGLQGRREKKKRRIGKRGKLMDPNNDSENHLKNGIKIEWR